jgi:hypothetical protein
VKRPLNTRQERFCEFIAAGENQTDAYLNAGFKVPRDDARKHAARLMTNDGVQARITELRTPQTKAALRMKEDNLRFLAEVIVTPLSQIGPDSPLCVEYVEEYISGGAAGKRRRGHTSAGNESASPVMIRRRVKKLDPLRAIELYSKMLGHFEPDRTEIAVPSKTLLSIKERAAQVVSALARRYEEYPSPLPERGQNRQNDSSPEEAKG